MPRTDLATDLYVHGNLQADSFTPPASSVGGTAINSGDPIPVSKERHRFACTDSQSGLVDAVTDRRNLHCAKAAGTIELFQAWMRVAHAGAATLVVDLHKNGVSVLSGTITLNNTHTAYQKVVGTLSSSTYAVGDVFEVVYTATAGGGTLGDGAGAALYLDEGP